MQVLGLSLQTWLISAIVLGIFFYFLGISAQGFQDAATNPCQGIANCTLCADTGGCGWCPDKKKCVKTDRMGFPTDSSCNKSAFILYSDKCSGSTAPRLDSASDRSAGAAIQMGALPDYSRASGGPCNATDLVEKAKTTLQSTIKGYVDLEMRKYGIPLKEGFQVDPKVSMLMAEIQGQVQDLVKKSVEAAKK
jgi:hypothetical protein